MRAERAKVAQSVACLSGRGAVAVIRVRDEALEDMVVGDVWNTDGALSSWGGDSSSSASSDRGEGFLVDACWTGEAA